MIDYTIYAVAYVLFVVLVFVVVNAEEKRL